MWGAAAGSPPPGGGSEWGDGQPAPAPRGPPGADGRLQSIQGPAHGLQAPSVRCAERARPLAAADVAREIGASVGGTARLLDVCAALGLLDKSDRGYSNTEMASLHLASDGEQSLHGLAAYHDGPVWGAFTHLGWAVREGAAWTPEPLPQAPHKWSTEATLQFMRASHGLSKLTAQHVATAFDLSPFTSACHLGGCTGALAHKLVQEYPRLQVTIFALPEVIKLAGDFETNARPSERVHFVPGDLSSDSLPPADLYIVCSLLHDWPDDRLHGLLSRVSGCCKPGAGLLLAELAPAEEEDASGAARRPLGCGPWGWGGPPEPRAVPAPPAAARLPGRAGGVRGRPAARGPGDPGPTLRVALPRGSQREPGRVDSQRRGVSPDNDY